MTNQKPKEYADFNDYQSVGSLDFHRQVAEGLRRAPIERSIAIRSIWNALFK